MGDLSVEYPGIAAIAREKHAAFMGRFGHAIAKLNAEHTIDTTRIRAKLDLLVKAFLDAGAIDEVAYGAVSSRDGVYRQSLCLSRAASEVSLYLLNTGKDVVVSDSVGLAQSLDTLDARIVLVTDTKRVCKRFAGVLDDGFDWRKMAEFVMDAIHEVMYDSDEARRIMLLDRFAT